jgi:CheY-like chemotaxis protein
MAFAGRRVLVVEDEYLVSLATIDLLESVGCVILGPEARLAKAVRSAQSEALDAAVLDIDVAGELVWPVADALLRRSVPFLFLSAYAHQDVVPARFAAVVRLDKPLEKDRLLRCLDTMWVDVDRRAVASPT